MRSSRPDTAARCRVARIARAVVTTLSSLTLVGPVPRHTVVNGELARSLTSLLRVRDRVDDDVREVVVDQGVHDLPAAPLAVHDARRLEHPQVLADQGLGTASASTRSCTQHGASRSSSTIAIRTGAARARSRSPAAA